MIDLCPLFQQKANRIDLATPSRVEQRRVAGAILNVDSPFDRGSG
jgi:hypothetical protein